MPAPTTIAVRSPAGACAADEFRSPPRGGTVVHGFEGSQVSTNSAVRFGPRIVSVTSSVLVIAWCHAVYRARSACAQIGRADGRTVRILVIEDDRKVASFVQSGLQQEGYAVDVMNEGAGAGERAVSIDYDAVVLDLMLPGQSRAPTKTAAKNEPAPSPPQRGRRGRTPRRPSAHQAVKSVT